MRKMFALTTFVLCSFCPIRSMYVLLFHTHMGQSFRTWSNWLPNVVSSLSMCVQNPAEWELFQWYWEHFLKMALGPTEWGPNNNMYYSLIMDAKTVTQFSEGKRLTTPMHEAKAITIWENNRQKWIDLKKWVGENPGKKQPTTGGKWSPVDSGQNDNGAWLDEGIQFYKDVKKQVADFWKHDKELEESPILALEKATLIELRKKHGLVCRSHMEEKRHTKNNKRRKQNNQEALPEPKRAKAATGYDDDDDEYL